jgi:peptidoglycan/LPS O-acetylase OafA/YrhL
MRRRIVMYCTEVGDDYRPDVDGLRAVAIVLVVAYHAFPGSVPGGFIGVDVFFVISGFLISRHIFKGLSDGSFSLLDFYARRCRRIVPALAAMLVAVPCIGWFALSGIEFNQLGHHLIGGATFTSNHLLLRESGYFATASEVKPFLHLWSLGIEEQFYLFWPAFLLVARRTRLRTSLLVGLLLAGCFALNVRWAESRPVWDFFLLPARLWELLIGCALAVAPPRSRAWQGPAALVLLAIALAGLDKRASFPGWWALLPTGAAALFITAGPEAWWNRRVLSWRPMVQLGLISYPWYLWHWPLLALARSARGSEPGVGTRLVLVLLSLLLAALTWRFVELPARRYFSFSTRRRFHSPRVLVVSSLLLLATLAFAGVLVRGDVIVSRDGQRNPLAYRLQRYRLHPHGVGRCFRDLSVESGRFDEACYRAAGPGPTIFVLGDSHAAHLHPGLRDHFSDTNVLAMTATNCPPLVGLGIAWSEGCHEVNDFVFAKMGELRPRTVILHAAWLQIFGRPELRSLLIATIRRLRDQGIEDVVVVGPVPVWSVTLHEVLEMRFLRAGLPLPPRTAAGLAPTLFTVNDGLRRYSEEAGARFISLSDGLCSGGECLTLVGSDLSSDLLVYDSEHLTAAGSRYIADHIVAPRLPR